MEYAEFVNGIGFTLLQPDLQLDKFTKALSWNYPMSILEMMNTYIPGHESSRRKNISALLDMPRMSTLAIAAALDKAVASMAPGDSFVNVGVCHGFTLFSAMVNNPDKICIGIDNFSEFGGPGRRFCKPFSRSAAPATPSTTWITGSTSRTSIRAGSVSTFTTESIATKTNWKG